MGHLRRRTPVPRPGPFTHPIEPMRGHDRTALANTRRWASTAILAAALTAGCAGQAFNAGFPESQEPEITRSLRALAENHEENGAPAIVGVTEGGLFAFDPVAGKLLWRKEAKLTSSPRLAGSFVVAEEGKRIVGRRLADGEKAFELEEGWRLVSADGDASRVLITAAEGSEKTPSGVVALVANGDTVWVERLGMTVGSAALVGERAVVPWATQRLSILEAKSGRELARARLTDSVVGHAFVQNGTLFVGQHGLFRVQPGLEDGGRDSAPYYEPMGRPLPGQPPLLADGYEPVPPPDDASRRVRLAFDAVLDGDDIALRDETIYYVFYRLVFALEADADRARWVHVHPSDVVGVSVTEEGPVVVDADGAAVVLASGDGQPIRKLSIGVDVVAAELRMSGKAMAGEPLAAKEPGTLAEQLVEAAMIDDARVAGGRSLAARYLGNEEGAAVTGHLVGLCANRKAPESVRRAACDAVTGRTEGVEHVRTALARHGSFLEAVDAPPVGALARAAATMKARDTVPALIDHLEDASTPVEELPGLITGLGALGVSTAAGPIEAFLRLHHADDDAALRPALVAAAGALAKLRGDRAEPFIESIAGDPLAHAALRDAIRKAYAEGMAPAPEPERDETAIAEAKNGSPDTEPKSAAEPEPRLERITARVTARVFQPVSEQLAKCVGEAPSARIAMNVDGSGTIKAVVVSPTGMAECITPIVMSRTFPPTQMRAEQVTYVVRPKASAKAGGARTAAADQPDDSDT